MEHRNERGLAATESADAGDGFERLLQLRDAEIVRLETCLAEERRAALAIRVELDQTKADYEQAMERQRQSTWTARLRSLIKR